MQAGATQSPLKQALELTYRLREMVKSAAWDEAAALAADRFRLIRKGLAPDSMHPLEEQAALIQEIQLIDKEIESIGQSEREKLATQLRQFKQGKKAGKAYRQRV